MPIAGAPRTHNSLMARPTVSKSRQSTNSTLSGSWLWSRIRTPPSSHSTVGTTFSPSSVHRSAFIIPHSLRPLDVIHLGLRPDRKEPRWDHAGIGDRELAAVHGLELLEAAHLLDIYKDHVDVAEPHVDADPLRGPLSVAVLQQHRGLKVGDAEEAVEVRDRLEIADRNDRIRWRVDPPPAAGRRHLGRLGRGWLRSFRLRLLGGTRRHGRHAQQRRQGLQLAALAAEILIGIDNRSVRLRTPPRLSLRRGRAEQRATNDEDENSECPSPLEGEGQGEGETGRLHTLSGGVLSRRPARASSQTLRVPCNLKEGAQGIVHRRRIAERLGNVWLENNDVRSLL